MSLLSDLLSDLLHATKRCAISRHDERRLADLKARRVTTAADLEAMAHWPEPVQTNLRNQLGWLDAQIERMESQ